MEHDTKLNYVCLTKAPLWEGIINEMSVALPRGFKASIRDLAVPRVWQKRTWIKFYMVTLAR